MAWSNILSIIKYRIIKYIGKQTFKISDIFNKTKTSGQIKTLSLNQNFALSVSLKSYKNHMVVQNDNLVAESHTTYYDIHAPVKTITQITSSTSRPSYDNFGYLLYKRGSIGLRSYKIPSSKCKIIWSFKSYLKNGSVAITLYANNRVVRKVNWSSFSLADYSETLDLTMTDAESIVFRAEFSGVVERIAVWQCVYYPIKTVNVQSFGLIVNERSSSL